MPEPIQSTGQNMCVYEPSQAVSSAPPAPSAHPADALSAASPPGVAALVSKHPPATSMQCLSEKTALLLAGGNLIRAAGAMTVATPTLIAAVPAIAGFIGSAIAMGVTTAALLNCQDNATKIE